MMKTKLKKAAGLTILSAVLLFLFTGCLEFNTRINLKPDGSGTVTQTFMMKTMYVNLLSSMNSEENGNKEKFSLIDEKKLRESADAMGKDVQFVRVDKKETEDFSGYQVVYSFKNIGDLRLNQNPGGSVPSPEKKEDPVKEIITFSFVKGNPSTLRINFPAIPDQTEGEGSETEPSDEDINMAKQIYEDMKLGLELTVDGTIQKTNATYRAGNKITLMEIDFNKLMQDEDQFMQLMHDNIGSIEGLKRYLGKSPGIKLETQKSIEVQFK